MSRTRSVAAATGLLVLAITPFAGARTGDVLNEGVRNGTASRETEFIARVNATDAAKGGYATRQSNLSPSGGGAIYGCRSKAGGSAANPPQNPCVRGNNLSTGFAFEFNASAGDVAGLIKVGNGGDTKRPFTTNATGVATGLNADRVDGLDATQIVAQARTKTGLVAENADTVGGQTPAQLRAKADDADALGGTSADTIKNETQPFSFRLADGGTRTIATSGPLTLTATCEIDDGGNDVGNLVLSTSADNSVGFDNNNGPDADLDSSETVGNGLTDATGTVAFEPLGPIEASAPDGSSLFTTGTPFVGLNVHGNDDSCFFTGAVVVIGATVPSAP